MGHINLDYEFDFADKTFTLLSNEETIFVYEGVKTEKEAKLIFESICSDINCYIDCYAEGESNFEKVADMVADVKVEIEDQEREYNFWNTDGELVGRKKGIELKEMQDFVGGYIEQVGDFIVNEEGRRLNLPPNKKFPTFVGNVIEVLKKQRIFDVWLDGKCIDTVFFYVDMDVEEVKKSLIEHDNYDPRIIVHEVTDYEK